MHVPIIVFINYLRLIQYQIRNKNLHMGHFSYDKNKRSIETKNLRKKLKIINMLFYIMKKSTKVIGLMVKSALLIIKL